MTSTTQLTKPALRLKLPLPLLGLAIASLIWWLWTTPLWHSDPTLADFSPERTFAALVLLFSKGTIIPHILTSLRRVFVGLTVAIAVGVPLGILVGVSRPLEETTSALFQFIRMISPLSWMPVAVMVLGIGDLPVYFLLSIAAVWPLVLNASAGVLAVNQRWLLLSQSLCATRWETLTQIIIPAIIPHLLTGVRLAIGIIWLVLVPAEMLGVSAGLGYYILDTRDRLSYSELVAVILIIGLIGYALDSVLRFAYQQWTHRN